MANGSSRCSGESGSKRVESVGSIVAGCVVPPVYGRDLRFFRRGASRTTACGPAASGLQGVKAKAPVDEVGKYFKLAVHAAVKHVDATPNSLDGIPADASPEELRAEIAKRVVMLAEKGYVDLEALPGPANGEVAIADEEDQEASD
jgi:hypothetical protein